MKSIRADVIGDATEKRLKEHGLELVIGLDTTAPNPLDREDSTIIGRDNENEFFAANYNGDMQDFVDKYSKEVIGCHYEDLIWRTVYSKGYAPHKSFTIYPENDTEFKEDGFIFTIKALLKPEPWIGVVSKATADLVVSKFEEKLANYNAWRLGFVYKASVMVDCGSHYDTWYRIYTYNNTGEVVINELIDQIIDQIDVDLESCRLELTFKVDNNKLPKGISATELFTSHIKNNYGFTPALGTITVQEDENTVKTIMLANTMPLFDELATEETFNLVEKNAFELNNSLLDNDKFLGMTNEHITGTLKAAEHYDIWAPLMLHVLISSLMTGMEGVELVSADVLQRPYKEVQRESLTNMVINQFCEELADDEDWILNDEEVDFILDYAELYMLTTVEVIEENFVIDSLTNRLLNKAFVCLNGDAYFGKEEDAIRYLNENGVTCTTFKEACENFERTKIKELSCYYTEWK